MAELEKIVTGKSYEEKYHQQLLEYTDKIGKIRSIDPYTIDPALEYLK